MAVAMYATVVAAICLGAANDYASGAPSFRVDYLLVVAFFSLPGVGLVILRKQPSNRIGLLLVVSGFLGAAGLFAQAWAVFGLRSHPGRVPGATVAAWFGMWLVAAAIGLCPFVVARFPNGTVDSPWLRRVAGVSAAALGVFVVAQAFMPDHLDGVDSAFRPIDNPLGWRQLQGPLGDVTGACALILAAFTLLAIGNLASRWRHADGVLRQQLRWVAVAIAPFPVVVVSGALADMLGRTDISNIIHLGYIAVFVGVAGAMAVAVLRYRLYDLDLVINRSLLFAALSACVVAAYTAVVALAGALLRTSGSVPAFVAAATVAMLFEPLRRRLRDAADRKLFGRRSDPTGVLTAVGRRLDTALAPETACQFLVDAVARELKLPYVALSADRGEHVIAMTGTPQSDALQITIGDRRDGILLIGHRYPGEQFRVEERELLEEMARKAGGILEAARLNAQLRDARERLVVGREDERRRIHRDLHDGLGPTLAALTLYVDAARELVDSDPAGSRELLEQLKDELQAAVADLRRLIRGLRPPALDELGLTGAIQEQATAFARGGLDVRVNVSGPLTDLAAAVEVAVYRIVGEALTNAARHSGARSCTVELARTDGLELRVIDDGKGIDENVVRGTGLDSIFERTAELGGTCTVNRCGVGGTELLVHLSLEA